MYFIEFLLTQWRLYKMLILMSLNSNKIITYHIGIEITLTETVKAKGYFLSTINKSAISSINLFFFQEVYWTLIIHEVTPHFISCTSEHSNNSQSQVLICSLSSLSVPRNTCTMVPLSKGYFIWNRLTCKAIFLITLSFVSCHRKELTKDH